MNIKHLAVIFCIASAVAVANGAIDPLGNARETCRKQSRLTRSQLASAKNHLEAIPNYLLCLVQQLKIPTYPDGTFDVDTIVRVVSLVTPPILSRAATECCNAQVIASGASTPGQQIVVFTKCLLAKITPPMFDLAGYLKPPVWPQLDRCFVQTRIYYY